MTDPDVRKSVSEAIEVLQDLVQPIRMAQANKFGAGPYMGIKNRVEELYMEHARPDECGSDDISNSGASVLMLDTSTESPSDVESKHRQTAQYSMLG